MFGCILENNRENTFSTWCSHFFTFSQLPNKTQPKEIHQWCDLSERKPIRRSGGFVNAVRSSAIGAMRVGLTISLLSLLSLSVSLFARSPEMVRRSRWLMTRFDESGFERSEWCDHLAPMQSGCILAPTRQSSCSFSLSLFYFPRPEIIFHRLAIFYDQPGNAF